MLQVTPQPPTTESDLPLERPALHPISLRAVLLGIVGVVYVSALAPINDYVMRNGVFIGGALPVGVVLFFVLFHLLVNGPLSRYAPRAAFRTGEMVTVLVMMLVACTIPTSGLMRFWPATLIGPWYYAADNPAYFDIFKLLNLPDWYWTSFDTSDATQRSFDPIVRLFYSARLEGDWTIGRVLRAWLPPLIGWGVFFGSMGLCLLGISFIVGKQWIDNERIAFPIAQVQSVLVQTPAAGRWLSESLGCRVFWIGAGTVLLLRLMQGLNAYFPKFPIIELTYNLRALFQEPPLSYVEPHVSLQTFWPIIIALTFFVSSRISFSLWAFVLLLQPPFVYLESHSAKPTNDNLKNIQLGSVLAFFAMILWTGRHHYLATLRLMFSRARPTDDPGRFLHPRIAGWMALLGFVGCCCWLILLGMPWFGALFLVGSLVMVWVVMANVVAHSGMPSPTIISGPREWSLPLFGNPDPVRAYNAGHVVIQYHVQALGGMAATASDQLLVYSSHGEKVASEHAPNSGRRLLLAIVLALVVGYFVAGVVNIRNYYTFSQSVDLRAESPINREVLLDGQPKWTMDHLVKTHRSGVRNPQTAKPVWPWVTGGIIGTGLLAWLQLTVAWWPLHPIGLLMVFSYPLRRIWFSIFLGWLIKVLVIRFGGPNLFLKARPFFLGIIVGDVLANGLFGGLSLLLLALGYDYEVVNFLPVSQF